MSGWQGPGAGSYSYSWTPVQSTTGRVTTSRRELFQITAAFLVLWLDFVLILGVGGLISGRGLGVLGSVPVTIVAVSAAIAFTAFLCHELAHKVSAQRYGYWAEFRWSPMGLLFSIFTAFIGFLFAAPGATVVSGMGDPRLWGRTSLAGPAANLGFAAIFYASSVVTWYYGSAVWVWLLLLAYFNAYFAAFNMIPIGPLDGRKVLHWNGLAWALGFAIAAVGAAVSYFGIFLIGAPIF